MEFSRSTRSGVGFVRAEIADGDRWIVLSTKIIFVRWPESLHTPTGPCGGAAAREPVVPLLEPESIPPAGWIPSPRPANSYLNAARMAPQVVLATGVSPQAVLRCPTYPHGPPAHGDPVAR